MFNLTYEEYSQHDDLGNAPHLLSKEDKQRLETIVRVSGLLICSECNKDYYSHPPVKGALWATKLCDGKLVKL